MDPSTLPWFALRVRRNCEKLVSAALRGKGYAEFVPVYEDLSRWSDRTKRIELPLFAGYAFCRFDFKRRLPILTIPGVMHVVSFGSIPEPISEKEIKSIRDFVASGLPVSPWPFLKTGDLVVVKHGVLAGCEGVLIEIKKRYRLVVSIELLQRSVAVEIDRDWVRPLANGMGPRAMTPSAYTGVVGTKLA